MTPNAPVAPGSIGTVAQGSIGIVAQVTFEQPYEAAVTLVTFAVLAALAAGTAAIMYRWYFRTEIPEGVAVLLGVAVVALYLNTTSLGDVVRGGDPTLLTLEGVFFNVVALGVAAAISQLGRYGGDRVAVDAFALTGVGGLDRDLSRVVRTVGRFTAVTLPPAEGIEDVDAYEPVAAEKKAELAETVLLFPRRLTVEELRDRLVERIKSDYGVGYVDVDLDEEGELEYFAVGSRATGIGPTLAPGRVAVALAGDPPNDATAGDMVQVWRTDPEPFRVATGELRGVAGDVATLALDESDAATLSVEEGYRLVTLPAEPQADREFASLLRNADETMTAVTVGERSDLVGTSVGDVTAVVAAVKPASGEVQAIPARSYAFAGGDEIYLVGRPDAIRRFEAAAAAKPVGDDEPVDAADGVEGGDGVEAAGGADGVNDAGGANDGGDAEDADAAGGADAVDDTRDGSAEGTTRES